MRHSHMQDVKPSVNMLFSRWRREQERPVVKMRIYSDNHDIIQVLFVPVSDANDRQ